MPETLWDGGPILHQAPGVFPMGTDSILLADFARVGKRDRILDLGTGSGILPVLLLSMAPAATASAVASAHFSAVIPASENRFCPIFFPPCPFILSKSRRFQTFATGKA